ncbi:CHAT domain-containing protein [Lamprocystis purpurea]|uniref:CHAT domain-containing protein n=1 Tax=Lamprocystis purpurea TaxID=61598 RepID=UPI00039D56DF|nr:CHAT domain-containing protein [Lamprocystis purpurea]
MDKRSASTISLAADTLLAAATRTWKSPTITVQSKEFRIRGHRRMTAGILVQDDRFSLLVDDTPIGSGRPLDGDALRFLQELAVRYAFLEQRPDPAAAFAIGGDLYRWVDGDQRLLDRLLEGATPPLLFSIHCPNRTPSPVEWALLQAPWELLANDNGYLAADALLQFSPQRRLGPIAPFPALDDCRLGLAFMAAAPAGAAELDYEAEETAILDAVGTTHLDLLVEESGEADTLGQHLAAAGGLPVLHLSCHGHHAWQANAGETLRPILLLEDGRGGPDPTDAAGLLRALRPAPPRLLFLSACLSAAASDRLGTGLPPAADGKQLGAPAPAAAEALTHSLTSALIQAGLPAVIGWDGAVADRAATAFAAQPARRARSPGPGARRGPPRPARRGRCAAQPPLAPRPPVALQPRRRGAPAGRRRAQTLVAAGRPPAERPAWQDGAGGRPWPVRGASPGAATGVAGPRRQHRRRGAADRHGPARQIEPGGTPGQPAPRRPDPGGAARPLRRPGGAGAAR